MTHPCVEASVEITSNDNPEIMKFFIKDHFSI
jgi:hypothetical protein